MTIGGVDVNTRTTTEPVDCLPLTLAIVYKQQHLITTLIELGANVNQREAVSSMTALYRAILMDDYFAAKSLLENGAFPAQRCVQGRTPMYAAIEKGNTSLIRLLVKVASPCFLCYKERLLCLFFSPFLFNTLLIRTLHAYVLYIFIQEYQVDINAVVDAEETGACALHIAAFLDNANATFELLLLGADVLQVDAQGRNTLDIAKDRPTSPVLHILLEHQSA